MAERAMNLHIFHQGRNCGDSGWKTDQSISRISSRHPISVMITSAATGKVNIALGAGGLSVSATLIERLGPTPSL